MYGTKSENSSTAKKKEKEEKKKKSIDEQAKEVWDKSSTVLSNVDSSYVFTVLKQRCRDFPTFEGDEIDGGQHLGRGGYSDVYEVINISFHHDTDNKEKEKEKDDNNNNNNSDDDGIVDDNNTHVHYDVNEAKMIMSKKFMRMGAARYAIKCLRPDLDKVGYARGALDLAIEIKFLSVLWHPNIVKMRAYSQTTKRVSVNTFIVMDRLYGTLEQRMKSWMETYTMIKGSCCFGIGGNDVAKKDLLKERLLVAYDLTGAFDYMHKLRLIYRDIKPENIGFDVRGDVKVFDFGLMKSLDESLKVTGGKYGYKLTAFTGSIPYMAPEVASREPYGPEADVYSFSMMLWEMITLEFAYPGMDIYDFITRIVKMDYRPPLGLNDPSQWPAVLKTVITEGWDRQPTKRPPMKRVRMLLRGLLEDMSSAGEESIANRSAKLLNRSRRSMHLMSRSRDGVRVGGNPVYYGGSGQMRMSNSKEKVTRGMSLHDLDVDF